MAAVGSGISYAQVETLCWILEWAYKNSDLNVIGGDHSLDVLLLGPLDKAPNIGTSVMI